MAVIVDLAGDSDVWQGYQDDSKSLNTEELRNTVLKAKNAEASRPIVDRLFHRDLQSLSLSNLPSAGLLFVDKRAARAPSGGPIVSILSSSIMHNTSTILLICKDIQYSYQTQEIPTHQRVGDAGTDDWGQCGWAGVDGVG